MPACALVPGAPRISLGPGAQNPISFNKIQTRLGALDDNLPSLRYLVSDAEGGTPTGQLALTFAHDGRPLPPPDAAAPELRELRLSGDVVGIGAPLAEIPPAGTLWPADGERTLIVRDLAGNQTEVEAPAFALNILPPPLFIAETPAAHAAGVADLAALDFEGLHQAAVDGHTLRVGSWSLSNPWPVPVSYLITRPAEIEVVVTGIVKPQANNENEGLLGTDPAALPAGPLWARTAIRPDCLAPDGVPDPTLEADAQVTFEGPAGNQTRVFVVEGDCRPRRYVNSGPFNSLAWTQRWSLPWVVGRVDGDRFPSVDDQWLSLANLGVQPIEGRIVLPMDLTQLLAGRRLDRAMTPVLDTEDHVLFWNEPHPECPVDGIIPTHCRRGWFFTRRVLDIDQVRIQRPALTLDFAALCVGNAACGAQPHPEPTTLNATTTRLNR